MSEVSYADRIAVIKQCVGFGKEKPRSCRTCRHSYDPRMDFNRAAMSLNETRTCRIGEKILGVIFEVRDDDLCLRHEERR